MDHNLQLFQKAKTLIPGGVHSPVRSFQGLDRPPIFMNKGQGAFIYDHDGNDYIDFCMSFGPLILGHGHPHVTHALHEAIDLGQTFGTAEEKSLQLAQLIIEQISFIDKIRFVNSGTEACMTAIRLARGKTNKDKIIKFYGCYHGHSDSMLIEAGSGLAQMGVPSSAGIPQSLVKDTLVCNLGDTAQLESIYSQHRDQIAAVIIEPLPANYGLLKQDKSFLLELRRITKENNSLLIFDEVISGFRFGMGGFSHKLEIEPDLVTYGKIIGGGLPVGAIAGKADIMELLAPTGPVYQAGTLSANPLAMQAGFATLTQLTPFSFQKIKENADRIIQIFNLWIKRSHDPIVKKFKIVQEESLFWIHSSNKNPKSPKEFDPNMKKDFKHLFDLLIARKIYISPSAFEVGFISLAHDEHVAKELQNRLESH